MHTLNVTRFGFALALSSALSYVSCVFVMMTVPKDVAVHFFNSVMHGVDVTPIMRWEMPWWEAIVGMLEIFVLGWLFGAILAISYNLGVKRDKKEG